MLTAIRCQAGTRRLWLRMRNLIFEDTKMEGTRVLVYILPAGVPRVARLIKFHLPILPHYSKYESLEIEDNKRYIENLFGILNIIFVLIISTYRIHLN